MAQAPTSSRTSRPVKKRSRNFDGCWTCRLRKIKCDCTKPTCLRCQRAKLECKGYSIVLAWAAPLVVNQDNQLVSEKEDKLLLEKERLLLRRAVDLVHFPNLMQYETYSRLNSVVSQFEDVSGVLRTKSEFFVGPFGVFLKSDTSQLKMDICPRSRPVQRVTETVQAEAEEIPDIIESSSSHSPENIPDSPDHDKIEPSIFSETDNTYVHYALLDSAKLTTLAIKGPDYKFSEQSMFHILYPNFFPNVDPDDWKPSGNVLLRYFQLSTSMPGGVIVTPLLTSSIKELGPSSMAFTRVVYNNNQWNNHVVPFIKRILFELILEEFPLSNSLSVDRIENDETDVPRLVLIKNIKMGIMLMCLATSSFRQSLEFKKKVVQNDVKKYYMDDELKASIALRKLGIYILNYHLDEYDNNSLYPKADKYDTYLLLAMLLQINLDDLYGVYENYELIFAIGDFLVKSKLKMAGRRLTPLEKYLRDMFQILQVFYFSTQAVNVFNYQISEQDRQQHYRDLDENYDISKNLSEVELDDSSSDESDDLEGTRHKNIQVASSNLNSEKSTLSFAVYFKARSGLKADSKNDTNISARERRTHRNADPIRPEVGDSSIYVSYGLPKSLLQLLYDCVQLTNHKRVFENQMFYPRNFPKVCADTEDRLLNWKVEDHWTLYDLRYDSRTQKSTKLFFSTFHEGLYHNVMSVIHAMKIYFRRLISRSKLSVTRDDVRACMDYVERVLDISEEATRRGLPFSFAPSFWPLLVSGCDIDIDKDPELQKRCRRLWSHNTFRKHNYWRSKQISFELWKRRSEGEEIEFMDLVREWAVILCLG